MGYYMREPKFRIFFIIFLFFLFFRKCDYCLLQLCSARLKPYLGEVPGKIMDIPAQKVGAVHALERSCLRQVNKDRLLIVIQDIELR